MHLLSVEEGEADEMTESRGTLSWDYSPKKKKWIFLGNSGSEQI